MTAHAASCLTMDLGLRGPACSRSTWGGGGDGYYVYDAGGQRVRKVIESQNGDAAEGAHLPGWVRGLPRVQRRERRAGAGVAACDGRQAAHRAGGDAQRRGRRHAEQLIRYQFGNHLGSASLELDEQAQLISYEEYHPYGSTAFQAGRSQTETPKRYRYTGKERDEERGCIITGRDTTRRGWGGGSVPTQWARRTDSIFISMCMPIPYVGLTTGTQTAPTPLEESVKTSSKALHATAGPPSPPAETKNANSDRDQKRLLLHSRKNTTRVWIKRSPG